MPHTANTSQSKGMTDNTLQPYTNNRKNTCNNAQYALVRLKAREIVLDTCSIKDNNAWNCTDRSESPQLFSQNTK